jgi:hypothetical protein
MGSPFEFAGNADDVPRNHFAANRALRTGIGPRAGQPWKARQISSALTGFWMSDREFVKDESGINIGDPRAGQGHLERFATHGLRLASLGARDSEMAALDL